MKAFLDERLKKLSTRFSKKIRSRKYSNTQILPGNSCWKTENCDCKSLKIRQLQKIFTTKHPKLLVNSVPKRQKLKFSRNSRIMNIAKSMPKKAWVMSSILLIAYSWMLIFWKFTFFLKECADVGIIFFFSDSTYFPNPVPSQPEWQYFCWLLQKHTWRS